MSAIECAAAWSLLNELAATLSSSFSFSSSENPASCMFFCADRPPSTSASSVISDSLRAMALSSFGSSCVDESSCFFAPLESASSRRVLVVVKPLEMGIVRPGFIAWHVEKSRFTVETDTCLPLIPKSLQCVDICGWSRTRPIVCFPVVLKAMSLISSGLGAPKPFRRFKQFGDSLLFVGLRCLQRFASSRFYSCPRTVHRTPSICLRREFRPVSTRCVCRRSRIFEFVVQTSMSKIPA